MTEFVVFLYALLTMFVITTLTRAQRTEQPTHRAVTLIGWGLFSFSSTLAVLMAGVAVALAIGWKLPPGFAAALS